MQMKLLVLAIVLTLCGCVSSPAPNSDTGFYEGSGCRVKHILRIGLRDYWIVEVINNNKRTTLLQCDTVNGLTMTVLNSEELQPETTYGEKNGR